MSSLVRLFYSSWYSIYVRNRCIFFFVYFSIHPILTIVSLLPRHKFTVSRSFSKSGCLFIYDVNCEVVASIKVVYCFAVKVCGSKCRSCGESLGYEFSVSRMARGVRHWMLTVECVAYGQFHKKSDEKNTFCLLMFRLASYFLLWGHLVQQHFICIPLQKIFCRTRWHMGIFFKMLSFSTLS